MKQILIDSGFLYSLYNPADSNYQRSQAFASTFQGATVIPDIILTETAFLFRRTGGFRAVATFLEKFAKTGIEPVPLTIVDIQRASEIMLAYTTSELDFVDCAIMAMAERLNILQVCTFDRRDFSIFRPKHCDYLELLP